LLWHDLGILTTTSHGTEGGWATEGEEREERREEREEREKERKRQKEGANHLCRLLARKRYEEALDSAEQHPQQLKHHSFQDIGNSTTTLETMDISVCRPRLFGIFIQREAVRSGCKAVQSTPWKELLDVGRATFFSSSSSSSSSSLLLLLLLLPSLLFFSFFFCVCLLVFFVCCFCLFVLSPISAPNANVCRMSGSPVSQRVSS